MAEFGKKAYPGQKHIPSRDWNALINRNTDDRTQPNTSLNAPRDYDLCQVENTSGEQADPFAALQTKTATWEVRTDDLFAREGMRRGVEVQGEDIETEWDNVTILQKSAPDGKFAPGVISGPTPCYIEYPDAASLDYPYAIPIVGDSTKLQASPYGKNRILWHADPGEQQSGCDPRVLQSYINMGEDGQWVFFKLQGDLSCCGSTTGLLVDECGTQIGACPIVKTIWSPEPYDDGGDCSCETGQSINTPGTLECWHENDVVPCLWYQYLDEGRGKWVTIPKETASAAGPWSLIIPQPAQIVCTEGLDEDNNTMCTAELVVPRKRLTVDGGCACLADEQSLALTLPTPDLLGTPTLTIDTGDATGADDDPCTCSEATLTFPVAAMSWCDGCAPERRTASVSWPIPPASGGSFSSVTSVTLSAASTCGSVGLCYTTQDYDLVCGGLCADGSATEHCLDVQLFETESIEYVTGVMLSDIQLDVTGTPTTVVTGVTLDTSAVVLATTDVAVVTDVSLVASGFSLATTDVAVVTGGSVSVSSVTGHTSYDRATGIDWTGVTWSVTLPTTTKTVITEISVNGCNINVTTETITVIDPDGTPTVTMTGTPTITHTSTALSMTFTPSISFTPTTQTLHLPTGITVASGALSKTTQTLQIPTGITLPSTALSVTTGSVNSVTEATATGGTLATTTEQKTVLLCNGGNDAN